MVKVVSKGLFYKDKINSAIDLYTELVEKTRQEEGCIAYNLFQDTKDSCILTMIEEWRDQDCLNNHFESEHFKRLVPQIGAMRDSSQLNVYTKVL